MTKYSQTGFSMLRKIKRTKLTRNWEVKKIGSNNKTTELEAVVAFSRKGTNYRATFQIG
jgi:hypothetical protein